MGLVRTLALRNLARDRFGTVGAILGVALGTATVSTVLVLDVNTVQSAASAPVVDRIKSFEGAPELAPLPEPEPRAPGTIALRVLPAGTSTATTEAASGEEARADPRPERADHELLRTAIRLGSLSAFLVGTLIVFFSFAVMVERRKREIALLRSLGALPGQVARVVVAEAGLVGVSGGLLGFALAVPMSLLASRAGFTTTGRAVIRSLSFPWATMLGLAGVGAATAVLGVLRPVRALLRLDVARTLVPRFMEGGATTGAERGGRAALGLLGLGLAWAALRFGLGSALGVLGRSALDVGLIGLLAFVAPFRMPGLIRGLGGLIAAALPVGPALARHLVLRRVQRSGRELAWSVSGLMIVGSLVLALHLAIFALEQEVHDWAARAVRPYTFVYNTVNAPIPDRHWPQLDARVVVAPFTARTPWPNPVRAVEREALRALLRAGGDPEAIAIGERLRPGRVLLSTMLARRLGAREGEVLELSGVAGRRRLEIAAVSDRVGYLPEVGPYRATRFHALLELADYPVIAPYAAGLGAAWVLAEPGVPQPPWVDALDPIETYDNAYVDTGLEFEADRVREARRDFAIFDLILALTTLLAAVGVANQLVLSAHARRRELAIYRVLGMTPRQIVQLFVVEGVFIGLLGGVAAIAVGAPIAAVLLRLLSAVSGFELRLALPLPHLALTLFGTSLVAVSAALHPALRASRAEASESIHYE